MSVSPIPQVVRYRLWGLAAGRCQYLGCPRELWIDSLTKHEFNTAYIAHIYADSPKGPRWDKKLSPALKADISNLMLLCDEHHRLIDKGDVPAHPPERLIAMKRAHEKRIQLQTAIGEDMASHVLLYDANVGRHEAKASWDATVCAMLPDRYPAEKPAFQLGLDNSLVLDHEPEYWTLERQNLQRQFEERIRPRLDRGDVRHLSIFGIAPQPLLMELGRLLTDMTAADVYQLHREPATWKWQPHPEGFDYLVHPPKRPYPTVALNLSLSATIDHARIKAVLGEEISLWQVTIDKPGNDFLRSREQLRQFREVFRGLLNRIKAEHGQDVILHIFPAVPVSVAIEIGRIWMPKADLSLRIYDQSKKMGGFIHAFDIE